MKSIIFKDKAKYLHEFALLEIHVHCPQCNEMAIVKRGETGSKLKCRTCGFSESSSSGKWYGPVYGTVHQRCRFCGQNMGRSFTRWSPNPKKLRCEKCRNTYLYDVNYIASIGGKPIDPYFGAPLWFKSKSKNGTIWFYNIPHLEFVEQYISAKIRIREPNLNKSLASRLPQWVLKSKNRASIVKSINLIKKKSLIPEIKKG